jgi:hypothetical protein
MAPLGADFSIFSELTPSIPLFVVLFFLLTCPHESRAFLLYLLTVYFSTSFFILYFLGTLHSALAPPRLSFSIVHLQIKFFILSPLLAP